MSKLITSPEFSCLHISKYPLLPSHEKSFRFPCSKSGGLKLNVTVCGQCESRPHHQSFDHWVGGGGKEDDYTLPELSAAAAQRFASGTPSPMTASFVLAPIILIIPQSGLMATDSSSFDPLVYPLLGYDLPFSGWKQPLSLEPIYPVLLKWFLFWVVRKKCNFLSYVMCFFFLPQNPLKSQCWLHQGWLFLVICFWLSKLTGIVLD